MSRKDPTKCGAGLHDWIPENIYVRKGGTAQECGVCKRMHNAARSTKKHERKLVAISTTPSRLKAELIEVRDNLTYLIDRIV